MGAKGDFAVMVRREDVVAAVLPMQEHWLPQSNLDLLLPPVDVGVFFCYKRPSIVGENQAQAQFGSMVGILKNALAQALVSYYVFGGEIVHNSVGEPELLCNNRGVDFMEAYADVEIQGLNFYNPDESIEGKLVPKKKKGVLCVQATELRCGALVVACAFDHRVADAYSTNMFLVSWAEMAQGKQQSLIPSFRRSLLYPRRPGSYDLSINDMYVPISSLPPPKPHHPNSNQLTSRIYYIEADQLSRLQSLASIMGPTKTKLEAFCAFLWKLVAFGESASHSISKIGVVVDGRTRLGEGESENTKLMNSYFGNVLSIPFGKMWARDLKERPLSYLAEHIHSFLEKAVTKEHFLDLVDWVEARRPEPALARIYAGGADEGDGPTFVVSSGRQFPVAKVDFGWGKPTFGSYHFHWGGESGYVMPMPSPMGNGDWVVYMHMLKEQLELVEAQAAHVLRPLTFDYLNVDE
ncbi:HXXXD-type acyl-transferase family protein [Actinidia rufa]|uniref:HXXXD-type acyl-transferase family protein n=1 Tax=Actinidia rufa TaxID=165716 RepID=A0A7J0ENF1_9ERIC|nr:HXXXD-type acyl-transferase family protein [Actinidia rufa]